MIDILKDYKELLQIQGELNYKAEAGQSCKEMYLYSGYLDYLKELCSKYNISFNDYEIEWEWGNYIQTKEYELEKYLEKFIICDKIME